MWVTTVTKRDAVSKSTSTKKNFEWAVSEPRNNRVFQSEVQRV